MSVSDDILKNAALRRVLAVLWHALGIVLAHALAYTIRFDFLVPAEAMTAFWSTLPVLLAVCLVTFSAFRLYSGLWSYFSVDDIARILWAVFVAVVISAFTVFASRGWSFEGIPRSSFILDFLLIGLWILGGRFALRYLREHRMPSGQGPDGEQRIVLVGQTESADLLIRALRATRMGTFVAIVTDDPAQKDRTLHGIRIAGTLEALPAIVEETQARCLLVLPPFNLPRQMNAIVDQCSRIRRPLIFRTIPSIADLAEGRISASSIRTVDIDDLLGRGETNLDHSEVRRFLKGKRILVTGAGGSIGREVCRQVAGYEPAVITLFENSEIALFTVERELRAKYPTLRLVAFTGDIRNARDIHAALDRTGGTDVIYHAAAYKHVPLMEENVAACVRTNVLGTARLARVAVEGGVDRFVMISSDKAVRPRNVMGLTKRIAERLLSEFPTGGTTFVSVRFGNVLGSSGSVVPIFKEQIARGGPVTVTSPEVTRFFMTPREAVDLVLLAGTVGRNGEIMVLEMGTPIRIVDLAKRLIELSGLVPEKDIKIVFTGLRPGEKEHEELMTEGEDVVPTSFRDIWVFRNRNGTQTPPVDTAALEVLVERNDVHGLLAQLRTCVPEHTLPKG